MSRLATTIRSPFTHFALLAGIASALLVHGDASAQGTCSAPYTPVTRMFTLNYGSKYLVAPPREPRTGGPQNITDAASLDAVIRAACPAVTDVEIGEWMGIPPTGLAVALKCFPAGTTAIPGTVTSEACWSSSNSMAWRRREGLWIRLLASTGTSCSFVWDGCDFTANTTTPGNEYNAPVGRSLVAPPYLPYTPATASNLLNDLGGTLTVANVQRYVQATDTYQVYTGAKGSPPNFTLAEGDGMVAQMKTGPAPDCPSCGLLTGKVYRDLNSSGTFDVGDMPIENRLVNGSPGFGYTNASGDFVAGSLPPTYTLQPVGAPGEVFVPATRTGPITPGTTVPAQDFGRLPTQDLLTYAYSMRTAPGLPVTFCPAQPLDVCANFLNRGDTTEANAELRLDLAPTTSLTYSGLWSTLGNCTYVPGAPTYTTSPHRLTWSLTGIALGQGCTVCATLDADPSLPLGTVLTNTASVYINGVTSTQDTVDVPTNTGVLVRSATCSFDPNDKQVVPVGCGTAGGVPANQTLEYLVRFQNLGNAPAALVVVRDVVSPDFDLATLTIVGTSHTLTGISVDGNRMVSFTFSGINLPPASQNDPGSRGYVIYRIRPRTGLTLPSVVANGANIIFDSNAPVFTNVVTNTVSGDGDTDTVLDVCDNCPAAANPAQQDFDGDNLGDACDPDDDNDGVADGGDCGPLDPGAFALPGEIASLGFAADKQTLSWSSAVPSSGSATVHDLMRGDLGVFPVVAGSVDHFCVANNGGPSGSDATIPASGAGFYYLARGQNSCGNGTYGFSSAAVERTSTACP